MIQSETGLARLTGDDQLRFSSVVTEKLRESRRRQRLTQADVARRTDGLVSKAALANYETGHRSLRIDVLWVIARALGEDLSRIVADVEQQVAGAAGTGHEDSIHVAVRPLMDSADVRLEPVRRWIGLSRPTAFDNTCTEIVTLDFDAQTALAELMQVSVGDVRRMLNFPRNTSGVEISN
ncbi:helix-turn-helix domain-containing protein [Nakamurella antarctica]|uniref:helix-turn-helix domain-containing protein n=1 Tax=Nakamurella antarctica TaxID=1902245 RepID=UPI0013DDAFC8|nr:helix-turn-helix transcriptional regulator [Nakamurella antarctica]